MVLDSNFWRQNGSIWEFFYTDSWKKYLPLSVIWIQMWKKGLPSRMFLKEICHFWGFWIKVNKNVISSGVGRGNFWPLQKHRYFDEFYTVYFIEFWLLIIIELLIQNSIHVGVGLLWRKHLVIYKNLSEEKPFLVIFLFSQSPFLVCFCYWIKIFEKNSLL